MQLLAGRLGDAQAPAEELGMQTLQTHCHRGLGTLYTKGGQADLSVPVCGADQPHGQQARGPAACPCACNLSARVLQAPPQERSSPDPVGIRARFVGRAHPGRSVATFSKHGNTPPREHSSWHLFFPGPASHQRGCPSSRGYVAPAGRANPSAMP